MTSDELWTKRKLSDRIVLRTFLRTVVNFASVKTHNGHMVCMACDAVFNNDQGQHDPNCAIQNARMLILNSEKLDRHEMISPEAVALHEHIRIHNELAPPKERH
jgi:hypothetical protein